MSESNPERRRYPRIKAKVPVEFVCSSSPPMRTTTDEISLCGCYIETRFTMDIGTKLTVALLINGEPIHLAAIVVTKYPQVGNGIDFTQIHPNDSRKLQDFITANQPEGLATNAVN